MFWKKKEKHQKVGEKSGLELYHNEQDGVLKMVTPKEMSGEENKEMLEYFSEQNDIPVFKGAIKHGYESDYLGYKHQCPRCDARTLQMMSNFAYATQIASRIASAPAGHFCTECPTVIIDDDVMRSLIDEQQFTYGGVFTIETGYRDDKKEMFETFNGKKPILILDEDMQGIFGLAQSVHQIDAPYYDPKSIEEANRQKAITQQKKKVSNKKKKKAAKKARKQNRKR